MTARRIVIVGGGVMGAATACFLARDHGIAATVIERDPSYAKASSALSASSIRQQFSTPVNIALSQASMAFYRRIGSELAVGDDLPEIGLCERGYLFLASAAGEPVLRANHAVQREHGVDVALLDPAALRERFPWLAPEGVALASLGLSGEGWFDGWSVLQAFRRKAIACGARFVHADALRLLGDEGRLDAVEASNGLRLDADAVLVSAGAWSARLLATAGVELPVRPRKRDVFVFDAPVALPGCPLVITPGGVWFRPEGASGKRFIAGAPPRGDDSDEPSLEHIDHGLFDDVIWPALALQVPAFEALRVVSAWAGYYEMNTFDHNGLAGLMPPWRNLYLACGFSGHGMQHAPAVGRAMASLVAGGGRQGLDLSPLSPARLQAGRPLVERNVI